jgi:hypothetical protein
VVRVDSREAVSPCPFPPVPVSVGVKTPPARLSMSTVRMSFGFPILLISTPAGVITFARTVALVDFSPRLC